MIGIVIADDHPIVSEGLRMLLSTDRDFKVLGMASDGLDALDLVDRLQPDVILLDLAMPRMSGFDVLSELLQRRSPSRAIVLTAQMEKGQVATVLQLGARGIILKDAATRVLFRCIRAVMKGEYWVSNDGVGDLVEAVRRASSPQAERDLSPPPLLTPRERSVLTKVADGASNKEIATSLGMSPQTVKNHMGTIFEKMGVSSRLELALLVVKKGLPPGESSSTD